MSVGESSMEVSFIDSFIDLSLVDSLGSSFIDLSFIDLSFIGSSIDLSFIDSSIDLSLIGSSLTDPSSDPSTDPSTPSLPLHPTLPSFFTT